VAKHKEYLAYPITKDWCVEVRAALEKKGRGSQARLLEFMKERGLKYSSGELSTILNGKEYQTSEIVEPVHEFLGWDPPMPPTTSRDAGELVHGFARMTKEQRDLLERAAEIIEGKSGPEAEKLIAQMVRTVTSKPKT